MRAAPLGLHETDMLLVSEEILYIATEWNPRTMVG